MKVFNLSDDKLANVKNVIRNRKSIRAFDTANSSNLPIKKLMEYAYDLRCSPFEGETRFEYLSLDSFDKQVKRRLGTYGFVKGAEHFLIGITEDVKQYDLENFGYLFEKAILYATYLNIGTVWLGGTFKRSAFESQINIKPNEKIPAITPLGFTRKVQTIRSKFIRYMAKGEHRKPFSTIFFDGEFSKPLIKSSLTTFADVLEMVRLSPSASNRQPWRVVKEQDRNIFHFFIFRDKPRTHRLFTWPDFKRIDLGIAVCHFDLTVKQLGLSGSWKVSDPEIKTPEKSEYLISWFES